MNEYVAGRGPDSYDAVAAAGIKAGFHQLEGNRDLVEWMRQYNADPTHPVPLRFYGFDSPTEATGTDSPRHVLTFVLDYLTAEDAVTGQKFRQRIEPLLGEDAAWESTEALMEPARSIGLSPEATQLRIVTEDLITELMTRRPELTATSGREQYLEALRYAKVARWLLTYHAETARAGSDRLGRLLGMRDMLMADNLAEIATWERGRGKVLAFAHTGHLQRGATEWRTGWPDGPEVLTWWPAGAHLAEMLGPGYAVIGTAVGVSAANGIGQPEPGSLEARLAAQPGQGVFIPTHLSREMPMTEIGGLPVRSGSTRNFSYLSPLATRSFTDVDWLAFLHESA